MRNILLFRSNSIYDTKEDIVASGILAWATLVAASLFMTGFILTI